MELTYLYHSGFVVETDRCVLVFDYWMDPANVMERLVGSCGDKHVYVFASHFHRDHFNKHIFGWREANPRAAFTYLLSRDILDHHCAAKEAADAWMEKGDQWHDHNISVTATGSNDSGVSWVVEVEGKRLFHAGDLCNWYARFVSDNTPGAIYSHEFGMWVNPAEEERRFLQELNDIGEVCPTVDIAMFPVDGRIGNGYTLGARQLISRLRVKLLVPMHFVMSGFESAWRMEPYCAERGVTFWKVRRAGDRLTVIDDWAIRQATLADLPHLLGIFAMARKYMAEHGNPTQWTDGYPSEPLVSDDIASGDCYVCVRANKIVATFVLREGVDPTYEVIEEGAWPNDDPYATIHRIASNGEVKGVVSLAIKFALQHHDTLRLDTHRDNIVMQRAIEKEGFEYCGVIHCAGHKRQASGGSGDATQQRDPTTERLAYLLSKKAPSPIGR